MSSRSQILGVITVAYIMPPERSVDIDEPIDFELAEFWIRRLQI